MDGQRYYTENDINRCGWCIFFRENDRASVFVAGAFENKEKADAECFRLNNIEK